MADKPTAKPMRGDALKRKVGARLDALAANFSQAPAVNNPVARERGRARVGTVFQVAQADEFDELHVRVRASQGLNDLDRAVGAPGSGSSK